MLWVFLMFNKVFLSCFDIGGIVDHYCLNFLFTTFIDTYIILNS